jgi:nucleoside phosphorylase
MHGMGNVNAAVATQQAIAAWDPLHVILAGIAGGVKEPLERMLGDVVVADQLVYYELAKTAPGGHRVRPEVFRRPCMFRG